MNKRFIKAVLSVTVASLLCGCSAVEQKTPVFGTSDIVSSGQPGGSTGTSNDPKTEPVKPSSSSTSSSGSSAVSSVSGPDKENSSAKPPASSSGSSSSVSTAPQSVSSSTKPQSTSSTKPQSSSSSTKPQSTVSSTTTSSSSETYEQPVIEPISDGSLINDYTAKWAYNHITENQKRLYGRLYNTAYNMGGYCDIADLGLTEDDVFAAYWAFDYDNPQFLELGSGYQYSYTESNGRRNIVGITIDYGRQSGSIPQSEFEQTAQNVLANARDLSSDYDKLKYIHDWIINNTVYIKADTAYESEADGPVVYGKAICEGYSKAFMYFAQSLGFECVCAIGSADGVDHMWNMVKMNGQWYHVDATWDDPVMSDGSNMLRYDYFMLSDSEIRRDHYIDSPFELPSAPYSYAQ